MTGREHGTHAAYANGCRCKDCQAARAAYIRQRRASAKADPARADRAGHGNASTYNNHGCRCPECRAAHAERIADYRARRRTYHRKS